MPGDNAVYLKPSVTTVPEAIGRMEEIADYIVANEPGGKNDGLACFNYLYTVITQRVYKGIQDHFFEDTNFLSELDLTFANRYLNALRTYVTDVLNTPKAWAVLLEHRNTPHVESIQFAVAGVNAHVNFDLALSVIETCERIGTKPNDGTQHADYQKVNDIFAEEMKNLREHYEDTIVKELDGRVSPVLNLVDNWAVVGFRDVAWEVAEHYAELRKFGVDESRLSHHLDDSAARSGAMILTPLY